MKTHPAVRATVALALLFSLAALVCGVVGVWTRDGRWGTTAGLLTIPAVTCLLAIPIVGLVTEGNR